MDPAPNAPDTPAVMDGRVVTVFRSRLRDGARTAYESDSARMAALAHEMPGFVELKTFTADDGERVSLVTFASEETHTAWRDHPDHRGAQRRGRAEYYDEYLIQVCRVVAERRFARPDRHP